jgi:hypothetical protein
MKKGDTIQQVYDLFSNTVQSPRFFSQNPTCPSSSSFEVHDGV